MSERILVVEDELAVIEMLQDSLSYAGYQVAVARDGQQALAMLKESYFNLVILDVVMPRLNGLETLQKIRKTSSIPVLMLTGRDAELDQVQGLELGADDYIIKPSSMAVIRARVRSALRRAKQPPSPTEPKLVFGDGALVIDQKRSEVYSGGQPAFLTPTEYRLLLYLIANAGQIIPHREMLAAVWGPGYEDPEVLKIFIFRLRAKIEPDPSLPHYIKTKRGRGYYFNLSSG